MPAYAPIDVKLRPDARPLLYYITDRTQLAADEPMRRRALLERIASAARAGVDYVQLREKDLQVCELEQMAAAAVATLRRVGEETGHRAKLLINSRIDVAIACGADGVHLPAGELGADEARVICEKAGLPRPTIGVSCHTVQEVALAESQGADFAVFGPVFGKGGQPGVGLAALEEVTHRAAAAAQRMPVLALGGVTAENAGECLRAGAAGLAGIRLFQAENAVAIIARLR